MTWKSTSRPDFDLKLSTSFFCPACSVGLLDQVAKLTELAALTGLAPVLRPDSSASDPALNQWAIRFGDAAEEESGSLLSQTSIGLTDSCEGWFCLLNWQIVVEDRNREIGGDGHAEASRNSQGGKGQKIGGGKHRRR